MSRVSASTDRTTSWALICDYQSGHCLHLSVVSQHVRRQSLERPEARFTLCFKTAPPLRHPLLRNLRGVSRPPPESPRWDPHRQRLKTQHRRNIHGNEICCQFALDPKESMGSRVTAHALPRTVLSRRTAPSSRRSAIHRAAQGLASGVISPFNPSVECCSAVRTFCQAHKQSPKSILLHE